MGNSIITRVDCLVRGIEIIRKYESDAELYVEDNCIYFGSYDTYERMTEEDKALLELYITIGGTECVARED